MEKKRIVVVLGMHRGGTSVVTRGLLTMGVTLGDHLMPAMPQVNAKGFWEDLDLVAFNIKILNALNSDWYHVSPIDLHDVESLQKKGYLELAINLLAEKLDSTLIFGFKDPRLTKLLPFWKEVFDQCGLDVTYVLVVRHPLSVIESLIKRDNLETEVGYFLWRGHMLSSLNGSIGSKRVLVDYDRLITLPVQELKRIARRANLEINSAELDLYRLEFLDSSLRHTFYELAHPLFEALSPSNVRDMYTELLKVASDEVTLDDMSFLEKLSTWTKEFQNIKPSLALIDKFQVQKTVLSQKIAELNEKILHLNSAMANLNQLVIDRDEKIVHLNSALANLNQLVVKRGEDLIYLNRTLVERDKIVDDIFKSKSWLITRPFRAAMAYLGKGASVMRWVGKGCRYALRGDFAHLRRRLRWILTNRDLHNVTQIAMPGNILRWGIMATPHTFFVAQSIASRLRNHGWSFNIMVNEPSCFDLDFYIVICPQMFQRLPPGEKRIVFQMEQSVSSRWFTSKYLRILESSLCILDYALVNIEFLAQRGITYPHIYYVPVGGVLSCEDKPPDVKKKYDVLFYGDANSSPRRRHMLQTLQSHFQVRICSEVFGAEMSKEISSAKVVINLHYYDNALLEMPRIQECLSLGTPVVSEAAQDQFDYPELADAVIFFAQGNEQAMVDAVRHALEQPVKVEKLRQVATLGANRFAFMFDRFLVAMNFLSATKLIDSNLPVPHDVSRVVLSMPETIVRRRCFESSGSGISTMFDGVRYRPGWVGCGLSYMALARHALTHGINRLTVLEDDALLPVDFEKKMGIVEAYLGGLNGQWDVFSGMIAILHEDVRILHVETFNGICFITLDKMTSMVCNIYNKSALGILASWDPDQRDDKTNTIDKYLERQAGLRVVVALPFLVGHREEVSSTLWGFQNTRYRDLITTSEQTLREKVQMYLMKCSEGGALSESRSS